MKKRILINAIHPEEKRVAIIEGETLADFYVESSGKEHLRGNIYKGTVVRVEPGLQAAFVDFGPKKHGFLQFREIKKEYFQKQKDESKRPRIQDVISKGQELIVQVEKDERDSKGASLTTFISLPGRYIVMMPGEEKVGISRKIEAREDRDRLKEIFNSLKLPKDMGFILRTACSDKTGEELGHDLEYLTKLWNKIKLESKKGKSPVLIYKEQDIAVRTVRDYLTSDVVEVLIDDPVACKITKDFLKKTTPWLKINIKQYKDKKPIFAMHNIEEQIAKIHDRHVYLPSRGYIVIDKTEALTAIDVNSGRSRKEENIEGTALRTNMEAAEEIARQLRIRDIGGLIVIDFIDMESSKNRREVEHLLKDSLDGDKAHTEIGGISKFGLVEMTRERMRPAFLEAINKKCDTCGGTGVVKSDETIAVTAFRNIHARASRGGVKSISCRMPVDSLNYILNNKHEELWNVEKDYGIKISIRADRKLSGEYEIDVEKTEEAIKAEEKEKAQGGSREAPEQRHPRHEPRTEKSEHKPEHKSGDKPQPKAQGRGRERGRIRDKAEPQGKEQTAEDALLPGGTAGHDEPVMHESGEPTESGLGAVTLEKTVTDGESAPGVAGEEQIAAGQEQPKRKSRGRYRRRGRGRGRGRKPEAGAESAAGSSQDGERDTVAQESREQPEVPAE
ncbi:MAG: ribonuclease E [Thermodesulfovibrio sp.]|nr:ribonuclease E [Thermodesulfovibrio sp.]